MSTNDPGPLELCIQELSSDLELADDAAAVLGSLIPVCLAVTLFSTPRLRKQWAFRLLAVALVVMTVRSFVKFQPEVRLYELYGRKGIDYENVYEDKLYINWVLVAAMMVLVVPFICDCALLCRLLAFHPASITPLKKRIAILAFPLAAHIPRLPLIIAYCYLWNTEVTEETYVTIRVVEGGLQLLVNCYCSGFLLHKTHQYARADYASNQQASSLRLRLRYLTESILFNFVPTSLAQLIFFILSLMELFPRFSDTPRVNALDGYLRLSISVFSLYFGLLAVWWTNIRSLKDKQPGEKQPVVKSVEDLSLLEWALGTLAPEEQHSNPLTRRNIMLSCQMTRLKMYRKRRRRNRSPTRPKRLDVQ